MVARGPGVLPAQDGLTKNPVRPLPNRVDPFGMLFATAARGMFLGNRGGQFHCTASQTIPARPYASRQWICCVLAFKDRRRNVWGKGYTELFFADEVSALAAGHRPCFECRRVDAVAFATAWGRAQGILPPHAPDMDRVLHGERLLPGRAYGKQHHIMPGLALPDATMIAINGKTFAVSGDGLCPWSIDGFGPAERRRPDGDVSVLTPPSIVAVLGAGYRPVWRFRQV
jgi:hypothetical protein